MRAIERLNKYLKIFNQETGEYLNLVGDETKTYPALTDFIKINDFDNGAIANTIEYTMQLADFIIDQLDVSKAAGTLLDYTLETFYNKIRLTSETDATYYARSNEEVFDDKVSNLAIADKLEDYGDDVEVIDGIGGDSSFYGVSYYENNNDFKLSGVNIVKKALFSVAGGRPYFFRVILSNVLPTQYKTIINVINEYKAGGVNYIVELREYFSQAIAFAEVSFYEYNFNDLTASPVVTAGFIGT